MQKKSKINVFIFMMLIILGLTFQPAISTFAVCPDDITSYWKLDETTAGTYADFINGKDGTGNANPTPAPAGRVNGAQQFFDDGVTATGIDVAADRSFNWNGNESFSIEFWVKTDGVVAPDENWVIIGRDDAATNLQWWVGLKDTDGLPTFFLRDRNGDEAALEGVGTISDGDWHHVVAVRDESTDDNILYVDGAEQGRVKFDYTGGFGSNDADLNIGWLNLGTGFYFDGFIDEVALYDRALDPVTEIPAHYNAGLAGEDYCAGSAAPNDAPFPDDTISLWQLDETTAGTYADAFDDNDGTGNANPTPAPAGRVNGAQQFFDDGVTATGIDVAADRSFNWNGNESFSIEFWVKTDGVVAPDENWVIIGRDDAATNLQWWVGLKDTDGLPFFFLRDRNGDEAALEGLGTISDGDWHHVVAVRDESIDDNILYVDGAEQGRVKFDYTGGFGSNDADLNIGYLGGGFYFDGFIDEVALYDRALDPVTEIPAHYNAGLAGNGVQSLRPPPDANAGPDQIDVKETTVVTLDGSGSSEGYPAAPITYLWEQTAGTPQALSDETAIMPTFTADVVAGGETLTFQLTVTADDGQSDSDTVDIGIVELSPPVAVAGVDQVVTEGVAVTLDGSGSSDPDGTIATYLWEQETGTPVTLPGASATPTATFTAPQVDPAGETLTFKLTVTDDDNLTSSDTMSVTVNDNPVAPTADAGIDQNVTEGDPVTLDGSGSTGSNITFAWTQTAGTVVNLTGDTTAAPTFTAPDITTPTETLIFQLTVTDGIGATSSDTVDVIVADVSTPVAPVADAGIDQNVTEGDPVTLDGSGSTGSNITFAWTQTAGTVVNLTGDTTAAPTFTAPDVAAPRETLIFQLTVTDGIGATSSDTVDVIVADASTPAAPVADAGVDQDVTVGDTVTLNGTGSTGTGITFAWSQTAGTKVQLSDDDTASPTFTAPDASAVTAALLETLTFQLTVTDNTGAESNDTVNVNVDDGTGSSGGGGGGGGGGCFITTIF